MARNGMILTAKKAKYMAALLTGKSIVAAAKEAEVGERTARRWMADPAFRVRLSDSLEETVGIFTRRLVDLAGASLDVLVRGLGGQRIIHDGSHQTTLADLSPAVQIGVAVRLVDAALKQQELLMLSGRLARLEQMIGEELEDE